jgi:transposase, IS30 family
MRKFKQLTKENRIQIESYIKIGKRPSEIAELLGRPKCTISREIKRNSRSTYKAENAQILVNATNKLKHTGSKIQKSKILYRYIRFCLHFRMSPEQISNKLRTQYSHRLDLQVSHESIYTYIYTWCKNELRKELKEHLRRQKSQRGYPKNRGNTRVLIPDRISIADRPEEVNDRTIPGHWESDLIIGKDGKSCIGTIVERTTRAVIIVKLDARDATTVCQAFAQELKTLPQQMRKTMTHDNGLEMAQHKLFTAQTQIKVFFADPYSSWQRGTNENTNMLIRDFFPKGTDFNLVTKEQLKRVQNILNCRIRKTLDWKSPKDVFEQYILKTG